MPNKSLRVLNRRHAGVVLAFVIFATLVAIATGCGPLPSPEQQAHLVDRRYDSLVESTARDSSPGWRADHFAAADLHGPFARPTLPAGADTNDAAAYFTLGSSIEWRELGLADRAFYWATRLDPTMATAYYARWDLRRHGWHFRFYADSSVRAIRVPNDDAALDSLRVSALTYDPFLPAALNIPPVGRVVGEFEPDRDPATAGFRAYAIGNYAKAVQRWGEAIRKDPDNVGLHIPRAFAWLHLKEGADSAIADLTALIDRLEHIQDSTIAPYLSKDFLYYAVGFLQAGQNRYPEARTAYESALVENLGFYMAHVRLSAIDFALHDTTAALNELQTASLMRSDDPVLLAFLGQILLAQSHLKDAEGQLRAAVHADTDFALSYAFLGKLAEQRHDTTKALDAYREYLVRASHTAPERRWVEEHLASLTKQ